jgi:hypothetical protein
MIKNADYKIDQIVTTIKTKISEINQRYRTGPDLYFYRKVIELKNKSGGIESFLQKDYHIEILYAALVSWGVDSRGAKMKYFDEFKANILSCSCLERFKQLENFEKDSNIDLIKFIPILNSTYKELDLMKTDAKLVSNSKLLHFLFPKLCIPMDTENTLHYFYGNTSGSLKRYIEIIKFSFKIMNMNENWATYLDDVWNTTIPKMIDNAIILLVGKRVK